MIYLPSKTLINRYHRQNGGRRLLLASTALSAALLSSGPAHANPSTLPSRTTPQAGQVVGGRAKISSTPGSLIITQSSMRAAINWQSFNVGSGTTVTFKQPNAQAVALNRVISNNPSIIAGRIDANGQIVLMNQSGVIFTPGSQVNAESLVVSTAGISAKNFMAGKMLFDAPPKAGARIVNNGTITMKQAGLAAFVAPQVVNRGTITATLGHVVLAGASTFTLDISGDGLVSIDVTQAVRKVDLGGRAVNALVTNQGIIIANGGTVTLTASAVDGIIQKLLDVRGVVEADSVGQSKGAITIQGIGGDLQVAGSLLARGTTPGETGGTIAVDATGAVQVAKTAMIDASGAVGGGVVALGTDAVRAVAGPSDRGAPTAQSVSIAGGARISADATAAGTGGDITLMSAERTTQNGALSAQGVAHGGTIETSSDGVISLSGTETVFAAQGVNGTILLDPATLVVGTGTPSAAKTVSGSVTRFGTATTGTSYVDPSILATLTGTVVLTAASLLSVQSAIAMNDTSPVTLESGGAMLISNAVNVGGSLEIDAAGSMVIGGEISAPDITLHDVGAGHDIAIGSVIRAGTVLAMLGGGTIAETIGGYVTAPTLTSAGGTIGGDVLLNSAVQLSDGSDVANNIGTLGSFAALGALAIDNLGRMIAHSLTVTGPVSVGSATLAACGIAIDGSMSITGALNMQSYDAFTYTTDGAIDEFGAGLITSATLTGNAGNVTLGGNNTIATLGRFEAGDFILTDPGKPLTIESLNATEASVSANGVTIAGPVEMLGSLISGIGPLTIGSSGGIAETTAGSIEAGLLQSAGTITGGAVDLTEGNNSIGEIGGFTASGAFDLADPGSQLTISGALQASSAALISNRLFIEAPISVSSVLALAGSNGIDQSGNGTITAGTLTSGGITIGGTDAYLNGAQNTIGTLGAFNTTDDFFLNDSGSALVLAGPLAAPTASIDAAGLTIAGSVSAKLLTLASSGGITETGTGALTLGTLTTGDASIQGDALLSGNGIENAISTITTFDDFGYNVYITDTNRLDIIGPMQANSFYIQANGAVTLTGSQEGGIFFGTNSNNYLTNAISSSPSPSSSVSTIILNGNGYNPGIIQTGTFYINELSNNKNIKINELNMIINNSGNIEFSNLIAPVTILNITYSHGLASGNLNVAGLNLTVTPNDGALLFGSIGGFIGSGAAPLGSVIPSPSIRYLINNCIIGGSSCRGENINPTGGGVTPPSVQITPTGAGTTSPGRGITSAGGPTTSSGGSTTSSGGGTTSAGGGTTPLSGGTGAAFTTSVGAPYTKSEPEAGRAKGNYISNFCNLCYIYDGSGSYIGQFGIMKIYDLNNEGNYFGFNDFNGSINGKKLKYLENPLNAFNVDPNYWKHIPADVRLPNVSRRDY